MSNGLFKKPCVEAKLPKNFWMLVFAYAPRDFNITDDIASILTEKEIRRTHDFECPAVKAERDRKERLINNGSASVYR